MSPTNTQTQIQTQQKNEKILFISATRGDKSNISFLKSISKVPGAEYEIIENNTEKLSVVYNRAIEKHMDEYDIICFIHDDVFTKLKLYQSLSSEMFSCSNDLSSKK